MIGMSQLIPRDDPAGANPAVITAARALSWGEQSFRAGERIPYRQLGIAWDTVRHRVELGEFTPALRVIAERDFDHGPHRFTRGDNVDAEALGLDTRSIAHLYHAGLITAAVIRSAEPRTQRKRAG